MLNKARCPRDRTAVSFTMSGAGDDYQEVGRMLGAKRGFEKPVALEELIQGIKVYLLPRLRHGA